MKDIRGVEITVGDVVVTGQRRGSGSGRLVIREVVALDGVGAVYLKGRAVTRNAGTPEMLVVPSEYKSLIGR